MFKLMKYEIKGSYKFVLATILVVAIAMVGMQYSISRMERSFSGQGNVEDIVLMQALAPLLSVVLIAAVIAFIVYLVQSYRRELYDDRGYLTFTLPLQGRQILGAKFIIAILWSVVFALVLLGINLLTFRVLFENFQLDRISFELSILISQIGRGIVSGVVAYSIVSSLVTLLTVYLSITISKVAIKNRTIGGLWILIFIGLQMLFGFIESKIVQAFPLYTNMRDGFSSYHNLINTEFGLTIDVIGGSPVLSLSALIYWIVLGISIFIFTSYLLDRKIEL